MYSTGIGELYSRRGVVPAKKYRIELTTEEQQELKALVSKGRAAALHASPVFTRASDEARKDGGLTDEEVARSLERNGYAAVAWRKGSKRPWGVRSNNAAGQRN